MKGLAGSCLSTTPARLSGRRGLGGLTGSFLDGGGGTAGLSKIPAWLFGRDGLIGLTGLLISVGEDARFKESFSSLRGHSRVLRFGGGYFVLVSHFASTCLLGIFGVGLRAIRGSLSGLSCLAGSFEVLVELRVLRFKVRSEPFRVVLLSVGPDILGLALAASTSRSLRVSGLLLSLFCSEEP